MKVMIILHSILREKLLPEAKGRSQLTLPRGSTIQDVISLLELPEPVLSSHNGVLNRDQTTLLKDGDELRFFRPGAGG
jgi:molybdopterin converting factor small subunit